MFCPNCRTETRNTCGNYNYRESGIESLWIVNCTMYVCDKCNSTTPVLPDVNVARVVIAQALVRQEGKLDSDAILFLRKAMRLKAIELADLLGVSRAEVSRWENDKTPIGDFSDFKLRLIAVERIMPADLHAAAISEIARIMRVKDVTRTSEAPIKIPNPLLSIPPGWQIAAFQPAMSI